MYALSAHGNGHIEAIVDDERDSMLLSNLVKRRSFGYQVGGVMKLVAILYDGDSWTLTELDIALVTQARGGMQISGSDFGLPTSSQSRVHHPDYVSIAENSGSRICHQIERIVYLGAGAGL